MFEKDSRGRVALDSRIRAAVKAPALSDVEVKELMERKGHERSPSRGIRHAFSKLGMWICKAFVCGS